MIIRSPGDFRPADPLARSLPPSLKLRRDLAEAPAGAEAGAALSRAEPRLYITQPDHAALAGEALSHWQDDDFVNHPRRDVILLAAREHDNGWIEEDAETHVDDAGRPLDFVAVPAAVRQRIWPRAVERMAPRSTYAAALIAQHAIAVYSHTRSDPAWDQFFERMTALRDRLLERTGIAPEVLTADYGFVNAADRMSLAFCTGWREPLESMGRRIILGPRNMLAVAPDPFAGRQVPLRVTARQLPDRTYTTAAEFRAALETAPVVVLEGEAVGGP
jgi:hypothetical protein